MSSADWQNTPFTVPLLLIGLLCAWSAYVGWRRRAFPAAAPFAVLMSALAGWALVNLVEKSLVHYDLRLAVSAGIYVFIVTVPGAWLVFAARFARLDRWLSRRVMALLFLEPVFALVLVCTNSWHGLFRTATAMRTDGSYAIMVITQGPFFYVNAAYTYVLFTTGAVLLVVGVARRPGRSVGRFVLVLGAMLVPLLGNIAYVCQLQPMRLTDLTPVYFAVPGLAAAWLLFRVRVFDVLPIARDFVFDCLGDPVLVVDSQGRILDANQAAQALLSDPAARLRHRPLAEALPELNSCLPAPPGAWEGTTEARLGLAGKERVWDIQVLPVREHGSALGALFRLTDVTERRQLEEELRRHAEQLAEADRRKDAFLATLGHELRNPLAAILSATQLLRHAGSSQAEAERARDVVDRQVKHLGRLIDDLLDVARIARGRLRLRLERLDLAQLVRVTVADYGRTLEAARLTLDLDVPAESVWVKGDSTRLAQVVGNLLGNAAKFTDSRGQVAVRLTVARASHRAVVTVRDTGIGIETGLLPSVFEPFTQAERGLDRSGGGLGLGLALVRGIVRLHGGEVSAASDGPGQGATFTFWIPLAAAGEPTLHTAVVGPRSGRLGRRVLLIEDNQDTAAMWRALLEGSGHEVAVAHSGPAGVASAQQFRPEVVLSDLGLPGMDGYAVARALRQDPDTATAHLIAVTGYGGEEDRRRARDAGFDHFFTKPVDPDDLLGVLAALP